MLNSARALQQANLHSQAEAAVEVAAQVRSHACSVTTEIPGVCSYQHPSCTTMQSSTRSDYSKVSWYIVCVHMHWWSLLVAQVAVSATGVSVRVRSVLRLLNAPAAPDLATLEGQSNLFGVVFSCGCSGPCRSWAAAVQARCTHAADTSSSESHRRAWQWLADGCGQLFKLSFRAANCT